jgi:hypothetical protein
MRGDDCVTQKQAVAHEPALNKAAELGIARQLNEVARLRVAVQVAPFKQVTGEVDAVAIVQPDTNSHSQAERLLIKDFQPYRACPYQRPTGLLTANQ